MEGTSSPETIRKEDIRVDSLAKDATSIVLQRHGKYIRDKDDERGGSITTDAFTDARTQAAVFANNLFSTLPVEERGTVDFLVIASDTRFMDIPNKGQRSLETGQAVLEGLDQALQDVGLTDSQILNKHANIHGGPGPRPTKSLREPTMFSQAPDFVKFLEEKYGEDFWKAFEEDTESEVRKQMGAEGPTDLGDRLAASVDVLSRYARRYHSAHPGRRLVIWADSHYDTISPYVKQYIVKDRKGYLPVDYAGGIAVNIDPQGKASTVIDDISYDVPLQKQS